MNFYCSILCGSQPVHREDHGYMLAALGELSKQPASKNRRRVWAGTGGLRPCTVAFAHAGERGAGCEERSGKDTEEPAIQPDLRDPLRRRGDGVLWAVNK